MAVAETWLETADEAVGSEASGASLPQAVAALRELEDDILAMLAGADKTLRTLEAREVHAWAGFGSFVELEARLLRWTVMLPAMQDATPARRARLQGTRARPAASEDPRTARVRALAAIARALARIRGLDEQLAARTRDAMDLLGRVEETRSYEECGYTSFEDFLERAIAPSPILSGALVLIDRDQAGAPAPASGDRAGALEPAGSAGDRVRTLTSPEHADSGGARARGLAAARARALAALEPADPGGDRALAAPDPDPAEPGAPAVSADAPPVAEVALLADPPDASDPWGVPAGAPGSDLAAPDPFSDMASGALEPDPGGAPLDDLAPDASAPALDGVEPFDFPTGADEPVPPTPPEGTPTGDAAPAPAPAEATSEPDAAAAPTAAPKKKSRAGRLALGLALALVAAAGGVAAGLHAW